MHLLIETVGNKVLLTSDLAMLHEILSNLARNEVFIKRRLEFMPLHSSLYLSSGGK